MSIADWQKFNRKIRLGVKSAPSQETLIREGDKIRRIRPDGSDGGYFEDGGHNPRSDHQTDSADAHGKQNIAYARTPAKDLLSLAHYHQNESEKHELERRGLWLDTSSKESLSQYHSNQLLNYLELTRDTDLQRVKNERQNIMSEVHDRDDISAEQTIKAMSTEELVVMRNEFIGLGGPPSFLRTAQLVYGELRNRRDQDNNKVTLIKNKKSGAATASAPPSFNNAEKESIKDWLSRLDETYLQKLIEDTSAGENDRLFQDLNELAHNEPARRERVAIGNWLRRLDENTLQTIIEKTSNKKNDQISQALNKLARNEQASRDTTEANRSEFLAKHDRLIDMLIKKYDLPLEVVERLVRTETNYEWVVNGVHAVGPMQIIPDTAKLIANKTQWTVDQIYNDEKINIQAGLWLINDNKKMYKNQVKPEDVLWFAIASYNASAETIKEAIKTTREKTGIKKPGIQDVLENGFIPEETRNYLKKIKDNNWDRDW